MSGSSMESVKALAALTALNEMFERTSFSICTIDKVAQLLGVHPEREAYTALSALHCVDWNRMPRELRDQVPQLIQQALGDGHHAFKFALESPTLDPVVLLDRSKHTRRPLLHRLLSR